MAVKVFAQDPSAQVEHAFRRIEAERMAGLPFCNAALRVEAVGFARHEDQWLGALVTPWTLNLILLPGSAATWISAPEGRRLMIAYPAGEFPFLGGCEDEIGEYLACPLIASMAQFVDQETARLSARASLIALLGDHKTADPDTVEVESPSRRRLFVRGS
ncbi:MAG: [NiFe]-hydrogenase assembly chaperone HybE [Rhodocyclales bacterium]|nr:[NiFe]-hydrogenase assembly chaperone HybE [Rhodocyclales bacterium]